MIFQTPNVCKNMLSTSALKKKSLRRYFHVSLSSMKESGTGWKEREKRCESYFFSSLPTPDGEEVHFWWGWRYSSSVTFYLYWQIKIWVWKTVWPFSFLLSFDSCSVLLSARYCQINMWGIKKKKVKTEFNAFWRFYNISILVILQKNEL